MSEVEGELGEPATTEDFSVVQTEGTPLKAAQVQAQVRRYIDQHDWDVADDEGRWRQYQQTRMAEEYRADSW